MADWLRVMKRAGKGRWKWDEGVMWCGVESGGGRAREAREKGRGRQMRGLRMGRRCKSPGGAGEEEQQARERAWGGRRKCRGGGWDRLEREEGR